MGGGNMARQSSRHVPITGRSRWRWTTQACFVYRFSLFLPALLPHHPLTSETLAEKNEGRNALWWAPLIPCSNELQQTYRHAAKFQVKTKAKVIEWMTSQVIKYTAIHAQGQGHAIMALWHSEQATKAACRKASCTRQVWMAHVKGSQ